MAAGASSQSPWGVIGSEILGMGLSLRLAMVIVPGWARKDTRLDLVTDNSTLDRLARGELGRQSIPGILHPLWDRMLLQASEFSDVTVQWRPRNSSPAMELADAAASAARKSEIRCSRKKRASVNRSNRKGFFVPVSKWSSKGVPKKHPHCSPLPRSNSPEAEKGVIPDYVKSLIFSIS